MPLLLLLVFLLLLLLLVLLLNNILIIISIIIVFGTDVPENQVKTDSSFQDILCLNDGLTANGLTANGLTTIPFVEGDGLASDVATLDLLDPVSLAPGPSRLANNAILALYRPSNNVVLSGVPGEKYMCLSGGLYVDEDFYLLKNYYILGNVSNIRSCYITVYMYYIALSYNV